MVREIPLWLKHTISIPLGWRLYKKPNVIKPFNHIYTGSTSLNANKRTTSSFTPKHQTETDFKGNLDENSYRFWVGMEDSASLYSKCRCCGVLCWNNEDRRRHQKAGSCTITLVKIYKLLSLDRKCIICDKYTERSRWGIPFCSEKCKDEFRFWDPMSLNREIPAMVFAMNLLKRI